MGNGGDIWGFKLNIDQNQSVECIRQDKPSVLNSGSVLCSVVAWRAQLLSNPWEKKGRKAPGHLSKVCALQTCVMK